MLHRHRVRSVKAVAAGLLAALALAGCSATPASGPSAEAAASTAAAAASLLPAAEGTTAYPLTLTTPWGESTLQQRPERIAAIAPDGSDTELLAALGVTPVLAPDTVERSLWVTDALGAPIETIYPLDYDAPYPLETIAAASPDLIVVIGGWEEVGDVYGELTSIAPVLAGETLDAFAGSWQDKIGVLASALDLSAAAETFVADYDDTFASYRSEHPEFAGKTATYAVHYGGDYGTTYFSTTGSDVEALFVRLGFAPNPLADQFGEYGDVSPELLGSLEADVLVLSDNSEGETLGDIVDQPLYQQLAVVRQGRVALITNPGSSYVHDDVEHDGNLAWAVAGSGPLAARWAAEQLVPILADTLA